MNDSSRLDFLLDKANEKINNKSIDESKFNTEMLSISIYNLVEDCLKNANNFYDYIDSVERYKYLGTIVSTSNAPKSYYRINDNEIDIILNYSIEFGNDIFEEGVIPCIDINQDYLNELLAENNIYVKFETESFRNQETQGINRILTINYCKNKNLKLKK